MTTAPDPETMSAAAGPREARSPRARLPLLRPGDGGVRHGPAVRERDRRRETGPALRVHAFGAGVLFFPVSCSSATSSPRWIRARAQGGLGGLRRLGFASFMSWAILQFPPARLVPPGRVRDGVRDPAHRAGLARRLLLRRVLQLVRAGQDEDLEQRAEPLDAHHRLHHRGRAGRLACLLSWPSSASGRPSRCSRCC